MTATIYDYFITGANESGGYPLIENEYSNKKETEEELVRVQIRFSEKKFGILIRHPEQHHWCGYIRVDPLDWATHEKLIRSVITPRVSYADYGNDIICWMTPDAKGRLRSRVQIFPTPDLRGDHWIGFSLRGNDVRVQEALAFLFSFEQTIAAFIK